MLIILFKLVFIDKIILIKVLLRINLLGYYSNLNLKKYSSHSPMIGRLKLFNFRKKYLNRKIRSDLSYKSLM